MIATIANNAVEIEKRQKTLEIRQQAIEEKTEKVLDVFTAPVDTAWHKAIINQFKKICHDNHLNYSSVNPQEKLLSEVLLTMKTLLSQYHRISSFHHLVIDVSDTEFSENILKSNSQSKGQPEEKPVDYCLECEKPLYEGDTVFCFNRSEYYCEDCIEECRNIMKK